MTLRELQEQRGTLLAAARERLDQINDNTDEGRAAELETQHDAAIAELDALDSRIEREQDMANREARQHELEERTREQRRPGQDNADVPAVDEGRVADYRQAFHDMLGAGGDITAITPEAREILRQGVVDSETRMQLAGNNAAGGYTVPVELRNQLIEAMEATGPMYNSDITFNFDTTSGHEIDVPAIDDTGDTSTEAHTEGSSITDDGSGDIVFAQRVLNAYIYKTPFVKWSYELGQDSIFNVELLLGRLLGKRLGKIANTKLTVGSGTNEPNGIVTASSLGNTAAATAAFVGDELIDLQDSLDEAYENGSTGWMMKKATRSSIRKLKDGDGNYLWQMGNVKEGTPESLLGKNLWLNEAMPAVGAGAKPIIYGDFKEYYVRRVGDPVLGVMRELFWPQLGIAGLIRFDGEIGDSRAVKHLIMAAS